MSGSHLEVDVTGNGPYAARVDDETGRLSYATKTSGPLLDGLKSGRYAWVTFQKPSVQDAPLVFTLNGSRQEIDRVQQICSVPENWTGEGNNIWVGDQAQASGKTEPSLNPRYDNEVDLALEPALHQVERLENTDYWGGDIRDGLSDPELQDLSLNQCEALCIATLGCSHFTHNGRTDTCFLKGIPDESKPFQGATSGVINDKAGRFLPAPTSGADIAVQSDLSANIEDSLEWIAGLKNTSRPLADTCEAERAAFDALARDFRVGLTGSRDISFGQHLNIEWEGNTLQKRAPIWLMVSSWRPVRFEGKGFVALGPMAPNPFGLAQGAGRTRALVALHARGAGPQGDLSVIPLHLESDDLEYHLVGYNRACEEEMVAKVAAGLLSLFGGAGTASAGHSLYNVRPGPAQLVLNSELGRRAFTHRIDLKSDHYVLLNDRRILLMKKTPVMGLNGAKGRRETEIVQKAGTNLQISPTHRFLALDHDGRTEIVDVTDGRTVTTIDSGHTYWMLGDSYVMTTKAPWAEVNLHSLFSDGLRINQQVTGPACCTATVDQTHIGVSLENSLVTIWGMFGHFVGSLQNPAYASTESPRSGYSSDKRGSAALFKLMMSSIGPVAPATLDNGFHVVGGMDATRTEADEFKVTDGVWQKLDSVSALSRRLAHVGISLTPLDQPQYNSEFTVRTAENQLERLGVRLADMQEGEVVLKPMSEDEREAASYSKTGAYVKPYRVRMNWSEDAAKRLEADARASGLQLEWKIPADEAMESECDHTVLDMDRGFDPSNGLPTVRDFVSASRLETETGPVWITRASCVAGATLGSLRSFSSAYILDLATAKPENPGTTILGEVFFFENDPAPLWFDHDLHLRNAGQKLVLFSPGNGVVAVYDRTQQKMVFLEEGLPDGDLLIDAGLTEDHKHLVQVNSDGGLHIYQIQNGKKVISGRIVEDEIVTWLDDFRFDATAEAAAQIDLRFDGLDGQYSLDRFGEAQRVQGLTKLVLEQEPIPTATIAGIPPQFMAGEVRLTNNGDVGLFLMPDDTDAIEYLVFQDGVITERVEANPRMTANSIPPEMKEQLGAGSTMALKMLMAMDRGGDGYGMDILVPQQFSVSRLKGARWASVVAVNKAGLASLPISGDLGPQPQAEVKNRALIIGINTYDDPSIPSLNYALRDGGRFSETLAGGLEDAPDFDEINYLKDTRATPEAILAGVETLLMDMEKGDHAVLYFAGHGLRSESGDFYFGTSGTRLEDVSATALAFGRLSKLLEGTEARITIILDACHSGATGTGPFATNDDAVADLSQLNTNITILAASKGREYSEETPELGGGVFTWALQQVLQTDRKSYDLDANGRIEASELYLGVKSLVVQKQQGRQTPWMVRQRMVGDYALF
ncbi:caspase family protein [Ruegeria arenilitoris]|uniref:caspase family protein n=1 Tax=Ruegeria arenilitoris TaxID=1173585 RepID=UPI00147A2EF7|nr:caspase family protein [Ruegeria arenilitoris]